MLGALLVFAVLCGLAGAWRGNPTSWALIASAGFSSLLIWAGVPFDGLIWFLIDLVVIVVILTCSRTFPDWIVVALFFAAWPLYPRVEAGDGTASDVVNIVVALQLIVSAPWRRFMARAKRTLHRHDDWTNLNLKVAA